MTHAAPGQDRLAAALAGQYRIDREIGAGGMATVFLAEDLKHKRHVAIKVLKPELAAVLGGDRFVQEITTTAALQHPHILPLFDSGTADGFLYYVMPFIEGETLRSRLDRETQLGVDESVRIARDVADALDYAHSRGVVHRDIKPENILLANGRPMVADFGIALAVSAAAGGRMTETGLSLGTPHYMSPEQATADKDITGRADVYSLASVLYEMLTGDPPHTGASAQQIIMKIVTEPAAPVTKHRKSVPQNVASALEKALEKLPADRFASAKQFADALADPGFTGLTAAITRAQGDGRWRQRFVMLAAASALLVTAAAVAGRRWPANGSAAETNTPPLHFRLALDPGLRIGVASTDSQSNGMRPSRRTLALSPDGSTLVFVGKRDSISQLYLRSLNGETSTPIAGTEGAELPLFSPDGKSVAFVARGKLQRVELTGGAPTALRDAPRPIGGSWSDDHRIAIGTTSTGIYIMSASGEGKIDTVGGRGAGHPDILPGGRVMIFSRRTSHAVVSSPRSRIEAMDLQSAKSRVIVEDGSDPRWLPSGHIVFARRGTLMAVGFNARSLEAVGTPRVIVDSVMQAFNGSSTLVRTGDAQMAVSRSGAIVLIRGGLTPDRSGALEWVDRQGRATPISAIDSAQIHAYRLSPDGRQVAITTFGSKPSLEIYDIERNVTQPMAPVGGTLWPLWAPDGRRVFHSGEAGDTSVLMSTLADGSRPSEIVSRDSVAAWPIFISPDGKEIFMLSSQASRLVGLTLADGRIREVPNADRGMQWPSLSADGKWLAYSRTAVVGTMPDVYVQPWPALDRKWKVSSGGGMMPMWAKGGRELLFIHDSRIPGQDVMYSVSVTGDTDLRFSAPQQLFRRDIPVMNPLRNIDVTADGSRFLIASTVLRLSPPGEIHVLLNWVTR